MTLKTFLSFGCILCLLLTQWTQAEDEQDDALVWQMEFPEAKALSAKLDRPILIEFTGTGWCINCKIFNQKIASTEAFKKFAREKVVLFKADFPMDSKQPAHIDLQNEQLGKHYGLKVFPTLFLVEKDGTLIKEISYDPEMSPEVFMQSLENAMPES
ncbi:thioredoxin family protein [Kiritimatiellaeota bacterium B1221]|nr:thioredoxin family protein [Kiritimatiellaeota bacterium B1221]